jgi:hypothetical protein
MKTIETLITDIKKNTEKSNNLRMSITQQKENLMGKVRIALEKEGLELQPKWHNDNDITIGNDLHRNIRVSFTGGNFRVDFPPIYKQPNAHIQFVIFAVLAKFQDEVMDIQLDIVNDTNMDRQDGKMELIDMIADNMVSSLLEGNCIQADSKSYKYIETIKGRIVVKITKIIMYGNEPESETKSYFPSKLKDIFRSSAHKKADTLIKN